MFFILHVQARQGVQPVRGVPWVQEVHAHQRGRLLPAFLSLPMDMHDQFRHDALRLKHIPEIVPLLDGIRKKSVSSKYYTDCSKPTEGPGGPGKPLSPLCPGRPTTPRLPEIP